MSVHRHHTLTFKVLRRLAAALLVTLLLTATQTVAPTPGHAQHPEAWILQGWVYDGQVGDEGHPLPGVTVVLYGANSPYPDPGVEIDGATTDGKGWYGLEAPPGYEFYAIRVFPPPEYEPVGATTVDGTVRAPDWIEYVVPLEDKTLTGNKFWMQGPAREREGPDLAILSADNWHFEDDDQVLVLHVEIVNQGNRQADPTAVHVGALDGGLPDSGDQVPALHPDQVTTVYVWVGIPEEQRGTTHRLWVAVDPDGEIRELDEGNNTAETPEIALPRLGRPPIREGPDLTILSADNWDFEEDGRFLVLHVGIVNQGTDWADWTEVGVEDFDGGLPSSRGEVPDLEPGQSADVDVRLEVPEEQRGTTHRLRVEVDPDERIEELDEGNNVARTPGIPIPPLEVMPRPTEPRPTEPRATEARRAPTPTPEVGGPGLDVELLILIAVMVVALGGLAYVVRRIIRRRGPRRPPLLPPLPPLRLVRIWLTEGGSGTGRVLTDHEHLIAGMPYSLHLEIQPRGTEGRPDEAPQREFGEDGKTKLDVVFFYPETDFQVERKTATLDLPRSGASNPIHNPIKPQEAGRRRLRACIYYRNALLQSVLLEATVVQSGERAAAVGPGEGTAAIARTVDYVASTDLVALEELPQPALNIFTNQTTDATHWIGAFASGDTAGFRLRTGDTHTFGPGDLATMAREARELLAEIEGKRVYRLAISLPLDVQRQLDRLEKDLVRLACNGYTLYDNLFFSHLDADDKADHLQSFEDALRHPCIISVARCRGESTSIPWAALYDHYLDTDKLRTGEIRLCGIFKYQLAANRWSADMSELVEKHDLLDDPGRCRSNPQCPLQGNGHGLTVCPFGFWGFHHQIEQPLQYVQPTSVDQVPEEMKDTKFNQTSFLIRSRDDDVRIAIAAYPNIPNAREHEEELRALGEARQAEIVCEENRDRVLEILSQGGRHLYYFYCHGEMEDHVFKLKLGPAGRPGYISAANLDRRWRGRWPDQPQPLVILNACDTLALTPELIHGFLGKLRFLGACGVVGSEVRVWTQLARPFGSQLVTRILEGQSVGEAFLNVRRNLLRRYNPLGLVYSFYSPATLHLHDPADCAWCRAHPPTRVSSDSS